MATIDIEKIHESQVKLEYLINISGADGSSETSLIDCSTLDGPNDAEGDLKPVLLEATWNIHPGYDSIVMYHHDEGNDAVIIQMTGDGYASRTFSGGGTIDVEASTPTEDDYDVLFNLNENGDEDANATAQVHLIFKKRQRT